jgi:hypothetical protein
MRYVCLLLVLLTSAPLSADGRSARRWWEIRQPPISKPIDRPGSGPIKTVPEPASMLLIGVGGLAYAGVRKLRAKRTK